jgi:hypothetical protein
MCLPSSYSFHACWTWCRQRYKTEMTA